MSMEWTSSLTQKCNAIIRRVAQEQIPASFEGSVDVKGLNQLVTKVDKEVETTLVEQFRELIPGSEFLAEEHHANSVLEEITWIIDPIDGTTNFIHSLPMFSISVALYVSKKPVYGAVFIPRLNEFFHADQWGAFLNDQPITVASNSKLKDALLSTGFPYYDFEYMYDYLDLLGEFMKNTRGLRRMGSAAIDLVYTACGRFDGFFEYGLSPWDVAAGAFIVQQAGGKVVDFNEGEDYLFGKEIIACSTRIYGSFYTSVNRRLGNG